MDIIQYAELLAKIAKGAVNENEVDLPSEVDFKKLFYFAKSHKLENLLYKPLMEGELSEDELEVLKKAYDFGAFVYVSQDYYLELITNELKKRKIKYMLLKGSVLKSVYPSPEMRQSADIDILIDEKNAGEIRIFMEKMGFKTELFGRDQDVYTLNNLVNVEMHRSLLPEHSRWYQISREIAGRAVEDGEFGMKMTCEDFYLFSIIHMAKHMTEGGTGLRSMLDTWVYLEKYEDKMDMDVLSERLEKAGLCEFEKNVRALCGYLFQEKEGNGISQKLLEYIAGSGWNGTEENKKAAQANLGVKENKFAYWFRYVFMSPRKLSKTFKVLEKYPYLVFFFWMRRLFSAIFVRRGAIKEFIHRYDSIEKDEIIRMKEFIQEIGL